MPGVNYAQPEPRHSASNWYTDTDAALMGIQSTAQFIEKYHHIIGKKLTKFSWNSQTGTAQRSRVSFWSPSAIIYFESRNTLIRPACSLKRALNSIVIKCYLGNVRRENFRKLRIKSSLLSFWKYGDSCALYKFDSSYVFPSLTIAEVR